MCEEMLVGQFNEANWKWKRCVFYRYSKHADL